LGEVSTEVKSKWGVLPWRLGICLMGKKMATSDQRRGKGAVERKDATVEKMF